MRRRLSAGSHWRQRGPEEVIGRSSGSWAGTVPQEWARGQVHEACLRRWLSPLEPGWPRAAASWLYLLGAGVTGVCHSDLHSLSPSLPFFPSFPHSFFFSLFIPLFLSLPLSFFFFLWSWNPGPGFRQSGTYRGIEPLVTCVQLVFFYCCMCMCAMVCMCVNQRATCKSVLLPP